MARANPRVVVITGASAGVGRAAVREFAKQGAHIGLLARNREALEAAKREVELAGGRAVVCVADVADAAQLEAAASTVERELGPIDVWVNNAMVTIVSPVKELAPEDVKRVTEVTYLCTVHGTLAALQRMLPRNSGCIVQVGSALAYRSIPLQAPYCGGKFAIRGFTDALRSELLHDRSRVHITMVQMPALDTPQFDWCKTRMERAPQPVLPIFAPEIAAQAIVWAANHRRRELIVGASSLRAIWANKFVPDFIDRYLARKGYESQLSKEPVASDRRDNLWATVPGDHGAHGRFGRESTGTSIQLWLNTHPLALGIASVLGLVIAGAAFTGVPIARDRWPRFVPALQGGRPAFRHARPSLRGTR